MVGDRLQHARDVRGALGAFFENARVPVIVVDAQGALVSANDAALAQYGWTLEELVHMRIHDLMAMARPELDDDLLHAHRGDPVTLGRRPHHRKDGSIVWVAPRAGPIAVCGKTYIVSVLQDVTSLVRAEDEAHIAQQQHAVVWDGAVEHFGRSFALLDRDRRFVKVNHTTAAWLDAREEDLVGKRCDEVFRGRCPKSPCPHALALTEGRRVVEEFVSSHGRPLRVEVWPAPPNDAGIATIHMAQDLSEERAVRTRLAATDRLARLGRVAAGVAHEVNNPAAFVTMTLPMVRDRLAHGGMGEALALLDEASAAMGQINEVMRDLGGVVREQPRAVVDLAGVVNSALRIASVEADGRACIVRRFDEGVMAEVRGPRLAQVILNLVLNAVQAIADEGPRDPKRHRIDVRVRAAGDRGFIEVADTGPGVPTHVGERVFEPFFTTRAMAGGTGLGLWLSRAIVQEEGGTLSWRNGTREEGGGAIFTVELPLWSDASEASEASEAPGAPPVEHTAASAE
jgi:PAS domain S-box-containing protein